MFSGALGSKGGQALAPGLEVFDAKAVFAEGGVKGASAVLGLLIEMEEEPVGGL